MPALLEALDARLMEACTDPGGLLDPLDYDVWIRKRRLPDFRATRDLVAGVCQDLRLPPEETHRIMVSIFGWVCCHRTEQ
jgi:hypothetical protein